MKTFAILLLGTFITFSVKALAAKQEDLHLPKLLKTFDGRITNGYPAEEGDVPYIVGLSLRFGRKREWCGGSVISNFFVLTAAHCTNGADDVIIYYGSTWRKQSQFTHKVDKTSFIQHDNWAQTADHDIALIRTPHISFGDLVNKIELPSFNDRYNSYTNSWAMACGWGDTYDTSDKNHLNCVDLEIIKNSVCQRFFHNINERILCVATTGGKDTCNGDSGGPLVSNEDNRLIGVTSFGSSDCQDGHPAGFTRVTSHLDWIRDNSGVAYY